MTTTEQREWIEARWWYSESSEAQEVAASLRRYANHEASTAEAGSIDLRVAKAEADKADLRHEMAFYANPVSFTRENRVDPQRAIDVLARTES